MPHKLEIIIKNPVRDVVGEQTKASIKDDLGIDLKFCHFIECYNIDADLSEQELEVIKKSFTDSIIQQPEKDAHKDMWRIEIGLLPGVTDNIGKTRVGYRVQVTALQEAAVDYNNVITYVCTPIF